MHLLNVDFIVQIVPEILIKGLPITLKLGVVSFAFGLVIGLFTALIRIYKIPVLRQITAVYISFFRGTPLMVQIMVFYFGIPILLRYLNYRFGTSFASDTSAMLSMYFTYSLYIGAFLSETIRSAILSVNPGQIEAGYSLGMSTPKVLIRVIIPQAITVALPNFGNSFIGLLKDTSLAFIAGIPEILGQAKIIAGRSMMFFEAYIAAALIYWVICIVLEQLLRFLEKKVRKHERRN